MNIRMAIIHELIAKRVLSKSIHELRWALAILTGGNHHAVVDFRLKDSEDGFLRSDLNGDGVINTEDFAILTRHWLETY